MRIFSLAGGSHFFLHHSNMDRLWDVWDGKQQRLKLPYLPRAPIWKALSDGAIFCSTSATMETQSAPHAGDYFNMEKI